MNAKKAKLLRKLALNGEKRKYFIKNGVIYSDPTRQTYKYFKKLHNAAHKTTN